MFQGEKVTLRAITRQDLPAWLAFENDLDLRLLAENSPPEPVSMTQLEAIFERHQKDEESARFAIEADGKYIGRCSLYNFDVTHRTCGLGIEIGDSDYWGQGYGRDAIAVLLRYAFRYRNLHKVCLTTSSPNKRAIRCYLACGFVEEGRLRQQQWLDGVYVDHVVMGILRSEWQAMQTQSQDDPFTKADAAR